MPFHEKQGMHPNPPRAFTILGAGLRGIRGTGPVRGIL